MNRSHSLGVTGCVFIAAFGAACGASSNSGTDEAGGALPGAGSPSSAGTPGAATAGAGTNGGGAGPSAGGASAGAPPSAGTGGDSTGDAGAVGDAGAAGSGGAQPYVRPNIVVVLLDDMGYSDLGAYGGEIRTPNIDKLAQTGTRFRNYYVTPRCSPTRMALLTGAYTQQVATMPGEPLPPMRFDNNVTIPEVLSAAGYRTYMAGKWHLGGQAEQVPRARGFDHVFGIGPQGAGAGADKWDKTKYGFVSKGNAIKPHVYGNGPRDFYQPSAMADYALDYLDYHYAQKDDAPFFMYMAFNSPHFPIQADSAMADTYSSVYSAGWGQLRTDRYARMLDQGVIDSRFVLSPAEPFMTPTQTLPAWASLGNPQKADLTRKMALYAASIQSVDTAVGRVVARLKAAGTYENTIILVQSDNGGNYEGGPVGLAYGKPAPVTGQDLLNMGQPGQGDGVLVGGGWAHAQNTPFRLFKHYTHGGGVRSPLVVSWPAHTAAPGAWQDQVAHVIDLAPTILDAARVTHPKNFGGHPVIPMEGASLVKTISTANPIGARQLGFEHETNRGWIDGNFKLVVRHENDDRVELYDLSTDPTELVDLAATQPARTKTMVMAWNAWATRVGVPADRQLKVP